MLWKPVASSVSGATRRSGNARASRSSSSLTARRWRRGGSGRSRAARPVPPPPPARRGCRPPRRPRAPPPPQPARASRCRSRGRAGRRSTSRARAYEVGGLGRERLARARRAGDRDEVEPAVGSLGGEPQPLGRCRRRDELDAAELRLGLDRQVGDDQAGRSGAPRLFLEALVAVRLEQRGSTSSGRAGRRRAHRVAARHSRQRSVRIPAASARSAAARITGPSASGSEKGKPISIRSAPPSTALWASSGVSAPAIR